MNQFFTTSVTGRVAAVLLGVGTLLPYLLRRTRLSKALGLAPARDGKYLQRMWPHYWAGYLALLLSVVHTWASVRAGGMLHVNATGLWCATLALCLLLLQAAIGLLLQDRVLPARRRLRSWHYWIMVALGFLIAGHVWLNT